MKTLIETHNLGKKYNTERSPGNMHGNLGEAVLHIFRKRSAKQATPFWALQNCCLKIESGESLGIVGPNGSGKSTLLKILARITPPSEGHFILHGRVGALLEAGTGFHHELSGRENIFLSGAMLGMSYPEMQSQFDTIVAFSGVESFIDMPIKKYSSGMVLRLSFAVMTHLATDVILLDETLSLGDVDFQKKALQALKKKQESGAAVVLVTHHAELLQHFCTRIIRLEKGKVVQEKLVLESP